MGTPRLLTGLLRNLEGSGQARTLGSGEIRDELGPGAGIAYDGDGIGGVNPLETTERLWLTLSMMSAGKVASMTKGQWESG